MFGRRKSDLEGTFRFKRLEQLERQIRRQSTLKAADFQRFIDQKIQNLAQRLALPLDAPNWPHRRPTAQDAGTLTIGAADFLPVEAVGAINANAEHSERFWRFGGLYLTAIIAGVVITGGALYFDYQIMTEFWTRVFADEFMEVPESLATSVVSKSAQVVFATVAFHFMISSLSDLGRRIFIWLFFLLTFSMIAGFGLLNANLSMPTSRQDLESLSSRGPTTLSDALQKLGLGSENPPEDADPTAQDDKSLQDWVEAVSPILWLLVPAAAFLAVTGIGALCIHLAETNLQNFVKSRDHGKRRGRMDELEELLLYKTLIDRLVGSPKT